MAIGWTGCGARSFPSLKPASSRSPAARPWTSSAGGLPWPPRPVTPRITSYFDTDSRLALVGDVAGVRVPPRTFVLPPTPPPDIDVEAWQASIDRVLAWHPDGLFLTHFGLVSTPVPHCTELMTRLRAYADLARACLAEEADEATQRARFTREMLLDMRRSLGEQDAARYSLAVPPDQCWQGLARYWKKRGSETGAG